MNHSFFDDSKQGISKAVMDVEKLKDLSHKLTKAEINYLCAKKICISEHSRVYEERKKHLQHKVNTKHLSFAAGNLDVSHVTDSLTINKHGIMGHSTNSSFFDTFRNNPSADLSDVDYSNNEY